MAGTGPFNGIGADQPTLMAMGTTVVGVPLAIITQTLGGGLTYGDVESHVSALPQSTEVRWLISSVGLSDLVDDETLSDLLEESEESRAAFELWKAAMEAGGTDNITLAPVPAGDLSPATKSLTARD